MDDVVAAFAVAILQLDDPVSAIIAVIAGNYNA
jgi:hypothetical protein